MSIKLSKAAIYSIFLLVLAASIINLLYTFPKLNEYHLNSDEGTYYKQGSIVKMKGLDGFRQMGHSFIANPEEQVFPPPYRIAHISTLALLLSINGSITTLSYFSLFCFIALCVSLFFFIKRYWNNEVALAAITLIAFSPLANQFARLALADSDYYLFSTLTLILFIDFINTESRRSFLLFISLLTISILIKETTVFLMPFFFVTMLYLKFDKKKSIGYEQIIIFSIVPLLLAFFTLALAFGGIKPVVGLFRIMYGNQISAPHPYILTYGSGPWYEYLVDFFLISPVISILFFLYLGRYITDSNRNLTTNILILFFIYYQFYFSFLHKNIRYAITLDFIYILFATLIVIDLANSYIAKVELRNAIKVSAIIVIALLEIGSFYKLFVAQGIYDPIAFNLLKAEKFIPWEDTDSVNIKSNLEFALKNSRANKTPENLLYLSLEYYKAGQFENCIEAANEALKLKPDYAEAYNNICTGYNSLKMWDKAIVAGEEALRLKPNFQLAKNNLALARSQKKAQQGGSRDRRQ